MKRPGLLSVSAKGLALAVSTWKALGVALLANAALALAFTLPAAERLRSTLPAALSLEETAAALWQDGEGASLLAFGLLSSLLASVMAGGLAGRFGAERDRGSLSAFGADAGRYFFSSLVLGLVSLCGIGLAGLLFVVAPLTLVDVDGLRYGWEATGLLLLGLGAFLLAAAAVRLTVAFARAAIGHSRRGDPFQALARGLGFLAGRPLRALGVEVLFGLAAAAPAAYLALARPWDGRDLRLFALHLAAQQAVVAWRILCRAGYLGTASAWMRAAAVAARPAPDKVEKEPVWA